MTLIRWYGRAVNAMVEADAVVDSTMRVSRFAERSITDEITRNVNGNIVGHPAIGCDSSQLLHYEVPPINE